MPSRVTRDHHTWTRDAIKSKNTGEVTIEAQDFFTIQVGKSDSPVPVSAFRVKDIDGNIVSSTGNF